MAVASLERERHLSKLYIKRMKKNYLLHARICLTRKEKAHDYVVVDRFNSIAVDEREERKGIETPYCSANQCKECQARSLACTVPPMDRSQHPSD